VIVRRCITTLLGLVSAVAVACAPTGPAETATPPAHPTELPGLHNLLQVRDDLWSGSTPQSDSGFQSLRDLGIRTVISVDAAAPDVNRARAAGLRYVHLPLGYGGVTREQAVRLAKAAGELPAPVYVHCHHGKHRGPTAAALMCRSRPGGWSASEAEVFLVTAGTDSRYEGLYAAVRGFWPPSAEELAAVRSDFSEFAEVGGLAARMVEIQDIWERLTQNPSGPPAAPAVLLAEQYREVARLAAVQTRPEAFRSLLADAERAAGELETAIRSGDATRSAAALDRCARQCAACHRDHRDR
jgi:protein tyrosine phosphatase (PTP) superfamily phosphohydrolase (DUF442 family)